MSGHSTKSTISTSTSSATIKSADEILHHLSKIKEIKYRTTELCIDDQCFPVIREKKFTYAILPTNTLFYKALPKDVGKDTEYTYPSYYTNEEAAKIYKEGSCKICKFITDRPVKLLVLNDITNIIELAKVFRASPEVKGLLEPTNQQAVKELFLITGLGVNCLHQQSFQKKIEEKLDVDYGSYKLHLELCDKYPDEELKRLSLYAVDLQFANNLCAAMRRYGCDGYVAEDMFTAFGEIAPVFHSESMFCFVSDCLKQEECDDG